MIKGDCQWDFYPTKDKDGDFLNDKMNHLHANAWPTIDELLEATKLDRFSTIQQILSGQALYFGYEVETHCNNDVPIFKILETDFLPLEEPKVKEFKDLRDIKQKRKKRLNRVVLQIARFRHISITEATIIYDKTERLLASK